MSKNLKIFFAALLIAGVFTQDKICEHLGFGKPIHHEDITRGEPQKELPVSADFESDYFISDTIYRWDQQFGWVPDEEIQDFRAQLVNSVTIDHSLSEEPIEVDWQLLMNIGYKLRYFSEIDMEIYAPVFSEAVKALNGKEVIIEGFVIPLDEGDLMPLSYNPYASCFFCGKASPASVISMYLKSKAKRYKMDDFKKFRGILYLNQDDPNEFYYILRDAIEEK